MGKGDNMANNKDVTNLDKDPHGSLVDEQSEAKKSDYGADDDTKNFLEHFDPETKHPLEPTAGMPKSNKLGERTTGTGFKLKIAKKEKISFSDNGQWTLNQED